jgi:hypothetical protein
MKLTDDNVLYHSLLGLASPQQLLGHLCEMATIRSSGLLPNSIPGRWGVFGTDRETAGAQ